MKTIYKKMMIALSILFLAGAARATIGTVEVEDFEFDPQIFTVNTGDTILWIWDEGAHTTTSTSVPAGATTWDAPITASSPIYMYMPTVPGNYNYHCTPHSSMGMLGNFTVVGTAGIPVSSEPVLNIKVTGQELAVAFNSLSATSVDISIYDMTGKSVRSLHSLTQGKNFNHTYSLSGMTRGMYFLQATAGAATITRKIVIE